MPGIDLTCSAPLAWPATWPRADRREVARFRQTLYSALSGLEHELGLLGAQDARVTANWRLGARGWPLSATQHSNGDPGVAVYFSLNGEERCIPCDRWLTVAANLQAIRLTVAALRGIDRWGTPGIVQAAFAGFAALPAGNGGGTAWWEVLGIPPTASPEDIEAAYRRLARVHHPDAGGSHEAFLRLAEAYQQARWAR